MNNSNDYRVLVFKTNLHPENDRHTVAGALAQMAKRWALEKRKDFVALYVQSNLPADKVASRLSKEGFECELFYGN